MTRAIYIHDCAAGDDCLITEDGTIHDAGFGKWANSPFASLDAGMYEVKVIDIDWSNPPAWVIKKKVGWINGYDEDTETGWELQIDDTIFNYVWDIGNNEPTLFEETHD